MSREEVCLRPQFKRVLRLYGFDDPNSFLIDSCPESATSTIQPPMSITTHGTVVTEITPISQVIQVSANITNGSASDISTVATEFPAKVTYIGDASFTISNIDTNTNLPMNSQTVTMIVDVETQPQVRPIESSTNQPETTVSINEVQSKFPNEIEVTDIKSKESIMAEKIDTSTLPITLNDPMMAEATVTQINVDFSSSAATNLQTNKIIDATNNSKSRTSPTEMFTTLLQESTTDDTFYTSSANVFSVNDETNLPSKLYVTSTENNLMDVTITSIESTVTDDAFNRQNTMNDKDASNTNTMEIITSITKSMNTESTADIIQSTKPMSNGEPVTTEFEMNTIPTKMTNDIIPSTKSELNNEIATVTENVMLTTDVSSTGLNSKNITENDIIKEAESNQHYQIVPLENKSARSIQSNDDLPTFNVEFVVRKEDIKINCNQTRKKTLIKPDRILTEYPTNSGISITLRESKKRRRRHLDQCNFKCINYTYKHV